VWTPNVDIAVCTIEKANSLLNKVIEEGSYRQLDIFVFDELHMILDGGRGYQIEYILSKLKGLEKLEEERILEGNNWNGESISPDDWCQDVKKFQIIGMSATMGRSDKLKEWLECDIFESDFRPVPLTEYYISDNKLYNKQNEALVSFPGANNYMMQMKTIISTYFMYKKSVILFCNTKNACEKYALKLSKLIQNSFVFKSDDHMQAIPKELEAVFDPGVKFNPPSPSKKNLEISKGRSEIIRKLTMTSVGL
jgi:replicative superfamily II helicase